MAHWSSVSACTWLLVHTLLDGSLLCCMWQGNTSRRGGAGKSQDGYLSCRQSLQAWPLLARLDSMPALLVQVVCAQAGQDLLVQVRHRDTGAPLHCQHSLLTGLTCMAHVKPLH